MKTMNFAAAVLIGLALGIPANAPADDTEIYTGSNAGEVGVAPNVVFILDTSGSMDAFDLDKNGDAFSEDRLDRMKDALYTLLDNVDNVNIGLMRFTDPGGPILFPAARIDADASAIENAGQPDVTVRISDDNDDAEELIVNDAGAGTPASAGDVKLDSFFLELMTTPAFGVERTYFAGISNDADDAEQVGTAYSLNSDDLETVATGGAADTFIRTTGFRFSNVEDVDQDTAGATVLLSQLFLTAQDNRSGDLDLKIFGLYAGDMDSFPGASGCPSSINCRLGVPEATILTFPAVENYSHTGLPLNLTPTPGGNITQNIVTWSAVPDTVSDEQIASPDISPVIQEIFDHPSWQTASNLDDLGLFYTGTTDSYRVMYSHDNSSSRAAKLRVQYVEAGNAKGQQLVALRFRNVRVPSDATIESAKLELTAVGENEDAVTITIVGEKVGDAPALTAAASSLSSRLAAKPTSAVKDWVLTASEKWTHEATVQTPDIAAVIEEIAGQDDWCGGNDLVIFLKYKSGGPSTRRVFAHDGNPSLSATLKIDYDDTAFADGQGCIVDQVTRQVSADSDDAEETVASGTTSLTSNTMQMAESGGEAQVNGVIFRNVPVYPGSTIESAVVEFTSTGQGKGGNTSFPANAATVTVRGEADDTSDTFATSASDISNRIVGAAATTAQANFSFPSAAAANNDPVVTADLSTVINEITGRADWDYNDDVSLIFTGSGQVDLYTHDNDASKSARLKLNVRYNIGSIIATTGSTPTSMTVRERLKEIIAELTHNGYTPIVDTLYEAALYFRGDTIKYGASRGTGGSSVERNTRLSHPASYLQPPGTVLYPTGCNSDDSNLGADACRKQKVLNSPNYVSPIEKSCQANFLVLLTDGDANHNNSEALIRTKIGATACQAKLSNSVDVSSDEKCGIDLAKYLNENDQSATVSGKNNVVTYTIGFNISTQFLKDIAKEGGGTFYEASSSAELAETFQAILTDVLSRATSFAAPSLSINAFNRLEDRNEVYFSLFEPSTKARWNGNIKKFQLCQSSTDDCATVSGAEVGDVLDSRDPPLKAIGADGRILDSALSFWSGAPDGAEVLQGGTGNQVPPHGSRRVLTFTDNATQTGTQPAATVTFYPSSIDLADAENVLADTDGNGIIDGLVDGTALEKETQTRELLGMGSETVAELNAQMDWIRGKDVDALFDDADFPDAPENRYSFSDPLHGNPLALTYGGTETAPIIKVFSATNDGGMRLINSFNGKEEWIFYPPSLLPLQQVLRANPSNGKRYGVDGSATPWIRDSGDATGNRIGVIEPAKGDFVRVFIGQRRGGNQYWGLDISPTTTIPDTDLSVLTHVNPKLMWRITGGDAEFPLLADTWSKPFLTTMLVGTDTANQAIRKTVLIFAGGYDEDSQDSGFGVAERGNAIYVVDAETGKRLFFVGGPSGSPVKTAIESHANGTALVHGVNVADMTYPIPSDVAAFDADGDGSTDRLYVGDTGGQMWRVDFKPNRDAGVTNVGLRAIVGKLATVSSASADADKRKFFYPPSIIQVRGAGSHADADYDLVSAVTGNRANPLNETVQDRFYAFRDFAIAPFIDIDNAGAGDGLADGYTTILGDLVGAPFADPAVPALINGDLVDFTSDDPDSIALSDPNEFTTSNGYFIRLETGGAGSGEKALAAPTTIAGKLFFTTYLPEGVVGVSDCALAEGRGQLYGINAITGTAIFNWDNDAGGVISYGDRTYTLGSGIPSNPVPIFFPEKVMLLVGVGGGAETVDPDIAVPSGRSYWLQE